MDDNVILAGKVLKEIGLLQGEVTHENASRAIKAWVSSRNLKYYDDNIHAVEILREAVEQGLSEDKRAEGWEEDTEMPDIEEIGRPEELVDMTTFGRGFLTLEDIPEDTEPLVEEVVEEFGVYPIEKEVEEEIEGVEEIEKLEEVSDITNIEEDPLEDTLRDLDPLPLEEPEKGEEKGEMDTLHDGGINPIDFYPSRGIKIWGQKTTSKSSISSQSIEGIEAIDAFLKGPSPS